MSDVEEIGSAEFKSGDKPHLQAVRTADGKSGEGEAPQKRGASRTIITLLCVALAFCVVVMLTQVRQTQRLEAEIVGMAEQIERGETALAAAESQIAAWEEQINLVRGSVGDLVQRLGALQQLVDGTPGVPESEPAE